MTKFELPSFQSPANSQKFIDNWENIFSEKNPSCKYDKECKMAVEEGNEWCNFHILTMIEDNDD